MLKCIQVSVRLCLYIFYPKPCRKHRCRESPRSHSIWHLVSRMLPPVPQRWGLSWVLCCRPGRFPCAAAWLSGETRALWRNKEQRWNRHVPFFTLETTVLSLAMWVRRQVRRGWGVFSLPDFKREGKKRKMKKKGGGGTGGRTPLKTRGSAHSLAGYSLQQTHRSSLQQKSPSVPVPEQNIGRASVFGKPSTCEGGLAQESFRQGENQLHQSPGELLVVFFKVQTVCDSLRIFTKVKFIMEVMWHLCLSKTLSAVRLPTGSVQLPGLCVCCGLLNRVRLNFGKGLVRPV